MDKGLILEALKSYKSFKSDSEFADYLEVSEEELQQWKRKHSYDVTKVCLKFPEITAEWLITGEGEILKKDQSLHVTGSNNTINNTASEVNATKTIERLIDLLYRQDDKIDRLIKIIEHDKLR